MRLRVFLLLATIHILAANCATAGKPKELYIVSVEEKLESVTRTPRYRWPVDRIYITTRFGRRRAKGYVHKALDLAHRAGAPVYAAADGRVVYSGTMDGYGKLVVIQHNDYTKTYYAHNSANLVYYGQKVTAGQKIAEVGKTGHATGNHLHFEIRIDDKKVNPMNFLDYRTDIIYHRPPQKPLPQLATRRGAR